MTHELKTPISIAYAANDVLLNYSSTTNEKQKKYLDIVREQLNHLSGLVEQILTLSVENRSTFRLHLETIQVAELLTPLIEQFKLKTDKPIDITTEVPEHMTVTADRTHLYNMLSNLIGNAIKYSGEKSPAALPSKGRYRLRKRPLGHRRRDRHQRSQPKEGCSTSSTACPTATCMT